MKATEIARRWHEIAARGAVADPDVFFQFIADWIAFNAIYSSRFATVKGERNQVHALASDPEAVGRHQELLKSDDGYRQCIDAIKAHGVFDYRKRNYRRIGDDLNLKDVLDCTYQIRCNLFHGDKQHDEDRDRLLVEAGFKIISEIVTPFI